MELWSLKNIYKKVLIVIKSIYYCKNSDNII